MTIIVTVIGIIAFAIAGPIIGCLLAGLDRIISARMQGRVGPPLLQPYYDVRKLFSKENASVNTSEHAYILFAFIFTLVAGGVFFSGGNLLLSVFLILMLVVFSLLTLSLARNNQDFAQTIAQEKKAYFSACNQAERGLAEMENGECNWELTISDSLVLWVEATREGDSVTVHRWQVKNAQPWRNEDTLTVLNP